MNGKLVEQTVQASIKVLLEWTGNVDFCVICEITILVGGPWKSNVVIVKSLKSPKKVAIICVNPGTN